MRQLELRRGGRNLREGRGEKETARNTREEVKVTADETQKKGEGLNRHQSAVSNEGERDRGESERGGAVEAAVIYIR